MFPVLRSCTCSKPLHKGMGWACVCPSHESVIRVPVLSSQKVCRIDTSHHGSDNRLVFCIFGTQSYPIRCRMHMLQSRICYVEHSGNILHCPWSTIQSLQFLESFMGRQGSGDDTFFMILRLRSLRHGGTCLYESKVVQKRLRMPGIWLSRSSNLAQRDVPLADVSLSLVRLLNKDVGIVLICSFSSSSFSRVPRCTTSLLLNMRFTQHVLKKYSG